MSILDWFKRSTTVNPKTPTQRGKLGATRDFIVLAGYDGGKQFSVDLGATYSIVTIVCADTSGVCPGTRWNAQLAPRAQGALQTLYLHGGQHLPCDKPFSFELQPEGGARRVKVVLSTPVEHTTTFTIQGYKEA